MTESILDLIADYPKTSIVLGLWLTSGLWVLGVVALFDGRAYWRQFRLWLVEAWAVLRGMFEDAPDPVAQAVERARLETATKVRTVREVRRVW